MRGPLAGTERRATKMKKASKTKAVKKAGEASQAGKAPKMAKTKPPKRAAAVADRAAAEAAWRARHLRDVSQASGAERELEELVFGDSLKVEEDELLRRLGEPPRVAATERKSLQAESSDSEVENEAKGDLLPRKPAWVDEDDEAEENVDMTHKYRKEFMKSDAEKTLTKKKLKRRLEEQFQQAMGGVPAWANLENRKKSKRTSSDSESDEDDDLLRRTGNFITSSESLPRGILKMSTCLPANQERFADGKLVTVQFHPSAQVVMTAGHDRSVSLFQVDGIRNPKIQSIYLESFPIYKARFSVDGEQVIATGTHHSMFFVYDMMAGNIIPIPKVRGVEERFLRNFELSPDGSFMLLIGTSGYLHLLSMKTKELISTMKVNGRCTASAFTPDSSKIYSYSKEGEVFIWDVRSRKCLHKFEDEGSLEGQCIAVSKNNQYVACGSSSGVVNLYTTDVCLKENQPKPVKAIMNLVTSATCVTFNPTTEILAVASRDADEAVKLVHIPSYTVFSNFPVFRRKQIYLAQSMDFSPRSGYFSVANNKGKALLFRLKHYSSF
ncbi:U3 small nucleolar RNA-associated protein 18 homolog [Manacus candei]|uniref:U3 small nucleolar RNA-associated protein 18 homolog n=1 Tax=Manacus candei TaxID=415023 RepID=UPI0022274587|nr:U3 small nucleolar RNA-associated protein 18 homolog [Manacus candei]XP_051653971.1 U3 small nucleolar RNA-associated protein 18 homolog [Manacus candei]XP_051653972.1 U3 small nucleolar RNA-associated protein 18 homolog [Manacus candei]